MCLYGGYKLRLGQHHNLVGRILSFNFKLWWKRKQYDYRVLDKKELILLTFIFIFYMAQLLQLLGHGLLLSSFIPFKLDLTVEEVAFHVYYVPGLDCNYFCLCVFLSFFFFLVQPAIVDFVNYKQCIHVLFMVPQIILFNNFFIKNGLQALFTHLKIISLQCFQFQFSVLAKISSIQT